MFGKIIRCYQPISSICSLCNKNTFSSQKNIWVDLRLSSSTRKYTSTSCPLLASQQNPKVKDNEKCEEDNEKHDDKTSNKTEEKQKSTGKNAKQSNETNEEKTRQSNTEQSSETSDAKKDKKKRPIRESIFGTTLVLHSFANAKRKEKETFLECLRMYQNQPSRKRERVPFIYAALKYMEEFGVHKDLSVYKQLIDIFPKQTMVPTNQFQTMFLHYPREQYCCTYILEKMEDNGVIPDPEMELMLLNIFGRHGMPLEKYWGMMYWMPKFKNLNPWPVPQPIPDDPYELAELAMKKISSVDVRSTITVFNTDDVEDSIDKTWIVSAMAPKQSELIAKHDKTTPMYVDGPFRIYVATKSVDYFTLRADPPKDRKYPDIDTDEVDKIRNPYLEAKPVDVILPPSVHEQFDSTIFANCATGMSTKDSLLSWIRCLQKENPALSEIPIIFKLRNYSEEKWYIEDGKNERVSDGKSNEDSDDKLLQ